MSYHQSGSSTHNSSSSAGPILAVMGAVVAALTLVSCAGALSGVLAGHGWAWPGGDDPALFAGLKALVTSPGDPAASWPGDVAPGPAWLVWACVVVLVVAVAAFAWWVWSVIDTRRARRETRQRGLASREDLIAANLTEEAAVARARTSTPALRDQKVKDIDPGEAAIYVGQLRGSREPVYVQHRDCTLIEGPTGAGKTWRSAVQRCWDAPGFLLATTTKADLIKASFAARRDVGWVEIFDPTGITGWPRPLRWALLAGCDDEQVAMRRAESMVKAAPLGQVKNAGFWESRATTVLRCYLMAAAVEGLRLRQVRTWVNLKEWEEPYGILVESNPMWAADIRGLAAGESDSIDDVFSTVASMLEPLADPSVAAVVDPPIEQSIDLRRFVLDGANTLYLACSLKQKQVAPIVAALAAEVYEILDLHSQHQPGGRLTVPARFVLDEVNNIAPIPGLPDMMTDSGGRGLSIWAYAHNRLQNEKRWGREAGREFTINAPNRIILPGLGDEEELASLSRLFGQYEEAYGPQPGQTRMKNVLSVNEIREMDEDQALMIYRGSKPIMLRMPTLWERPDLADEARISEALFDHICQTGNLDATVDDLAVESAS